MNTCDTCRFWGEDNYGGRTIHRQCNHPNVGRRRRGLPVMLSEEQLSIEESAAFPVSSEDASFYTGPKFGCVLQEQAIAEIGERL